MVEKSDLHQLTYEEKEVTLVGTAHVSKESADLVERVIQSEKPDTVCVELCRSRYEYLTDKKQWEDTDLIKVIRQKKSSLLLVNLVFAYLQRKIGEKLGIRPGEEIMRAIKAAGASGARIHLADRDIRITLLRTWRLMGLWTKLKLLAQVVTTVGQWDAIKEEDVEEMKKRDVLEMLLGEIGKSLPAVKQVLIDERDQYLAHQIRGAPGKRIVAVVGAGHIPGIQRYWRHRVDIDLLNQTAPRGKVVRSLKWGVPSLAVALIITGFFIAGGSGATLMIKWWVLANALLAGLGAALALGHPLTVLSAIVASPLTSLNPMIAAGWVSGLTEILVGRPKVRDFESLSKDLASVRGFWKNKITRVLLVVVFTNIGSALGTFVAIPLMARAFA
jgi:pheromone shutdown-related protein TraB